MLENVRLLPGGQNAPGTGQGGQPNVTCECITIMLDATLDGMTASTRPATKSSRPAQAGTASHPNVPRPDAPRSVSGRLARLLEQRLTWSGPRP
ncbi:MAG: hypothetical protein KDD83_25525 [Caldilineaceae bacterium]|nr:hypothetical protein [Caldilineaceae bacterium]